jgi:hypothetical protein
MTPDATGSPECEEGQRHRRPGADDRLDLVTAQDTVRERNVAQDVARIATANEVHEVDGFPF